MKLRNKKTGEILEGILCSYPVSGDVTIEFVDENAESGYSEYARYRSLAELNEEWEDYAPKEPLIKDENIRKAVRAWSYINCVDEIVYAERDDGSLCNLIDDGIEDTSISFVGWIPTLKDGEDYTITELCGEEE